VADSVEAMMAEHVHEGEKVSGHRPLARLRVIRPVRRNSRVPIATQVGADDAISSLNERWSHCIPRGVRTGMTMDQQHGWPIPPVSDPQA
jgi:hypothetical protein